VIFGELTKENLKTIKDLNWREISYFAPLIILALFMGIYPKPFLDVLHVSVENLVEQTRMARAGGADVVADLMPDVLAKVLR
jgi:NADH-quinone oxidoreductase subunit M